MSLRSRSITLALTMLWVIATTSASNRGIAAHGGANVAGAVVSAAGGGCPTAPNYLDPSSNTYTTLSAVGVTQCYFIANSGNDSNTGTSESAPWAHAPGDTLCSSKCSSALFGSGTGFIFRGGDSWTYKDYMVINAGGKKGAPVWYGADQGWFTGSSWTRPLWALTGHNPNIDAGSNSDLVKFQANWVTFDNWEVTGAACYYTPTQINQTIFDLNSDGNSRGVGIVVSNSYFHSFQSQLTTSGGEVGCGPGKVASGPAIGNNFGVWVYMSIGQDGNLGAFTHNIVDGSDGPGLSGSTQGYWTIAADGPGAADPVSYNVIHDVCSGATTILGHDNEIYNFGVSAQASKNYDCTGSGTGNQVNYCHDHALRANGDADYYNNVIHDVAGEVLSLNPNTGSPGSHVFNNVLYHNGTYGGGVPFMGIQTGDNPPNSSGIVYIYNNTIDCDSNGGYGSCIKVYSDIGTMSIHNEHHMYNTEANAVCISNSPFSCGGSGTASTFSYTASDDYYQNCISATCGDYSVNGAFPYAPISSSDGTVTASSQNETSSMCGTEPALCLDTTVGSTQNGGTLTAPARTPNNRPSTGSWNAGAYVFGSNSGQPTAPTGLSVVVQ